uniref:Putative secreted salivary gland peptide ixodes scapularis secreted salivary gland peptide n=1 Tax=Amblyomma triste TaxID=251400 RepID=A0A023GNI2_AMBTT
MGRRNRGEKEHTTVHAAPALATYGTYGTYGLAHAAPAYYGYGVGSLGYGAGHYGYGHGLLGYGLNYGYGLGSPLSYSTLLRKKK